MRINGIGQIKKADAMKILTTEGKKAVKTGNITTEELGMMYKIEQVKKNCKIGQYNDTFLKNYNRIPDELKEKLSPNELAELTDAFYKCYGDGKNAC